MVGGVASWSGENVARPDAGRPSSAERRGLLDKARSQRGPSLIRRECPRVSPIARRVQCAIQEILGPEAIDQGKRSGFRRSMADRREIRELLEEAIAANKGLERAHRTSERATTQFYKLLGTIHGGLGVVLAAWLQRIFENPSISLLHSLLCYLAGGLVSVALGLVLLATTAILDQRSSNRIATSINADKSRFIQHVQLIQLRQQQPSDDRYAKEFDCIEELRALEDTAKLEGDAAKRINRWSEGLGTASLGCLVIAFIILAVGVLSTVHRGIGAANESHDIAKGVGFHGGAIPADSSPLP